MQKKGRLTIQLERYAGRKLQKACALETRMRCLIRKTSAISKYMYVYVQYTSEGTVEDGNITLGYIQNSVKTPSPSCWTSLHISVKRLNFPARVPVVGG